MDYLLILISSTIFYFSLRELIKKNRVQLLLPIFYNFIVIYVLLGSFFFDFSKEMPFDLFYKVKADSVINASLYYIYASVVYYIGCRFVRTNKKLETGRNGLSISFDINNQYLLISLIFFVHIIYIYGYGVEPLIYRRGYIDSSFERDMFMLKVFFMISPFLIVLIPFVKNRIFKYLIYFFSFFILFGASSRYVIMVPLLYMVGTYIKYSQIKIRTVVINSLILCSSLVFVLQIRNEVYHGIVPNIHHLFSEGLDREYLFLGINYALSFSLYGTAYVLENFTHNAEAFYLSITPLPSSMIDIDVVLQEHKMIGPSPISAISALVLSGFLTLTVFYFFLGFVFSNLLERLKGKSLFYFIILGLFVLFVLFSVQYNLRGATRFIYFSIYTYFISIFIRWMMIIKSK
ncbi:oligosaccharide repeat unit polymerase [Vibrio fluvialis]|nr:oligosaccharide repeat unit polymerase [Vibrio fluvialis]